MTLRKWRETRISLLMWSHSDLWHAIFRAWVPWCQRQISRPWIITSLRWRHNGRDSVSNHRPHDCLLNRLFRRRSKKTSKLRVTGLCVGNSPGIGEFPAQMASNAANVSIWWRHHVLHHYVGYNYFWCPRYMFLAPESPYCLLYETALALLT